MAEKNNAIVFLVVGILVGAAAGAAIGYFMWNGSEDIEETTYWFYLDYQGTGPENAWISAESDDGVVLAFKKALDENSIEYEISETGWVSSIGGVAPSPESWMNWFWTASGKDSTSIGMWTATPGLDVTLGDTFYFAVTGFDSNWAALLDPNAETAWKTGGPFSS